jgi:hypothetical protein
MLPPYFSADLFPKKPAKNGAKIRFGESGDCGINKKFWPEYSPLFILCSKIILRVPNFIKFGELSLV